MDSSSAASTKPLRIGTRASALARWQAEWVASQLAAAGYTAELIEISTRGDRHTTQAIGAIGGDGLFTKELQRALIEGTIDIAVHSLKDLPTEAVAGLCIAAVPARAPVGDALVSQGGLPLAALPAGATIGTGSLRRRAQLLHARPELVMKDIRGNVDTRLRKLHSGEFDAIVLAEAGLTRLGLVAEITERLSSAIMLPAVGQGALGIECRVDDTAAREAVASLDDADTHRAVVAEREMLRALSGGCLAPVAGYACATPERTLRLTGVVLSADGVKRLSAERITATESSGHASADSLQSAEALGRQVADDLLAQGAAALIAESRGR